MKGERMNDARIIAAYQTVVKILESYGISVKVGNEMLSAQKYKDGEPVLFENFYTASELLAYACGYEKASKREA